MTVVVAVKDRDGNIVMGADRQASTDETKVKLANPKVFKHSGYLIGYAGSMAGEKLFYNFEPGWAKDIRINTDEYMQTHFLRDLRAFYDEWWIDTSSDSDLSLLIAVDGKIYEHNACDMSMTLVDSNYTAIGSGSSFAYGALFGTENVVSAQTRVEIAVQAANKFSPFCGFGLDIVSTKE